LLAAFLLIKIKFRTFLPSIAEALFNEK